MGWGANLLNNPNAAVRDSITYLCHKPKVWHKARTQTHYQIPTNENTPASSQALGTDSEAPAAPPALLLNCQNAFIYLRLCFRANEFTEEAGCACVLEP